MPNYAIQHSKENIIVHYTYQPLSVVKELDTGQTLFLE